MIRTSPLVLFTQAVKIPAGDGIDAVAMPATSAMLAARAQSGHARPTSFNLIKQLVTRRGRAGLEMNGFMP
jgi:hypothetical protein